MYTKKLIQERNIKSCLVKDSSFLVKLAYFFKKLHKILVQEKNKYLLTNGIRCAIMNNVFSSAEWSSLVARRAHNPKVGGSNPPSATKPKTVAYGGCFSFCLFLSGL